MICRPLYMYCTLHNYSHCGQLVYILTLTSYNHTKPPEAALKQLLLVLKLLTQKSLVRRNFVGKYFYYK